MLGPASGAEGRGASPRSTASFLWAASLAPPRSRCKLMASASFSSIAISSRTISSISRMHSSYAFSASSVLPTRGSASTSPYTIQPKGRSCAGPHWVTLSP